MRVKIRGLHNQVAPRFVRYAPQMASVGERGMLNVIIAIVVTWVFAHIYYKLSSREQTRVYNKLSSDLKECILADARQRLSVSDLNEILSEKTIDGDSDDPLPYKACPVCGSDNIYRDKELLDVIVDADDDGSGFSQTPVLCEAMRCEDCGWCITEEDRRRL